MTNQEPVKRIVLSSKEAVELAAKEIAEFLGDKPFTDVIYDEVSETPIPGQRLHTSKPPRAQEVGTDEWILIISFQDPDVDTEMEEEMTTVLIYLDRIELVNSDDEDEIYEKFVLE